MLSSHLRAKSKSLVNKLNFQKYSTVVNLKIDNQEDSNLENSYVNKLQHEWQMSKPFEELPGPTKFQMFRSFMKGGEFAGFPFNKVLRACRERYGNIFMLPGAVGQPSTLITYNVNDFERIFRTEGTYPIRPGGEVVTHYRLKKKDKFYSEEYLGVAGNGKQWGKFRHAVNPVLMQPKYTRLYIDPLQTVNSEFIQRIREIRDPSSGEVPGTFLKDINHLAFESVANVALDKKMGLILSSEKATEGAEELFKNLFVFARGMYDLGIKPSLYKYIKTPTYRRFEKAMDIMFDISLKYTNEAVARLEKEGTVGDGNSILEKLLKVDRKIAVIMAIDMLIGGVEVTSSVLTGILLAIAKNPDKQEKLRQEILTAVGQTGPFTIENTKNLPYLRACIKEGMRLYPVTFGNFRATGSDIPLSGYKIPKGTPAFLISTDMLRDEQYFPQSSMFLPERWLRTTEADFENVSTKNMNPFVFLPFGFGPRSCVGKRIVDLEMEITIANIVRNFVMEFNYSTENAFENYFMSTPVIPLKFKFTDLKQ